MLVTARGPNLKSVDSLGYSSDKDFFLTQDKQELARSGNYPTKTRAEVCLEGVYYNQFLAAKAQGADAFVLTLLSNGYFAAEFKDDKNGEDGMDTISRRAAQTAVDKFKPFYGMEIRYDFFDASEKVEILNHITEKVSSINIWREYQGKDQLVHQIDELDQYIKSKRAVLSQYRGIS